MIQIIDVNGKEAKDLIRSMNERDRVDYAMSLWLLQEKASLSYKEARAYLAADWEPYKCLAERFGTTLQAIYTMRRRAEKKIEGLGLTKGEILGEYDRYVLVDP